MKINCHEFLGNDARKKIVTLAIKYSLMNLDDRFDLTLSMGERMNLRNIVEDYIPDVHPINVSARGRYIEVDLNIPRDMREVMWIASDYSKPITALYLARTYPSVIADVDYLEIGASLRGRISRRINLMLHEQNSLVDNRNE